MKFKKCDNCGLNYIDSDKEYCEICVKAHPELIKKQIFGIANFEKSLIIGAHYTFDESAEIFRHQKFSAGICYSRKTNTIALYSVDNRYYNDYWENDEYLYVGEGREGNQRLIRGNKRLADSKYQGIKVHLFIRNIYQGVVELARPYYIEKRGGRDVYIFPLKKVSKTN